MHKPSAGGLRSFKRTSRSSMQSGVLSFSRDGLDHSPISSFASRLLTVKAIFVLSLRVRTTTKKDTIRISLYLLKTTVKIHVMDPLTALVWHLSLRIVRRLGFKKNLVFHFLCSLPSSHPPSLSVLF